MPTLTRADTGFVFCVPRDFTLARDVVVVEGLFTTLFVRAVREAVPRVVPVAERGEEATARVVVFVRAPDLLDVDIARDAEVERLMVLRCATVFG